MNIQQIKEQTKQKTLAFVRQTAEGGEVTPWLSHWDNDSRIRVTAHEDVINQIKAKPDMLELGLKTETVLAHKSSTGEDVAEYTRFVIITPKNIEFAI